MPKIDLSKIDDVSDFSPIPDGKYFCRLVELEEDTTKSGDEMWKLRLKVLMGPHKGRLIFDNMVFSDRAMPRVKHICSSLGLGLSNGLDLTPDLILDRSCYVNVFTDDYTDQEGNIKKTNKVPYTGYEPAKAEAAEKVVITGDDVPF